MRPDVHIDLVGTVGYRSVKYDEVLPVRIADVGLVVGDEDLGRTLGQFRAESEVFVEQAESESEIDVAYVDIAKRHRLVEIYLRVSRCECRTVRIIVVGPAHVRSVEDAEYALDGKHVGRGDAGPLHRSTYPAKLPYPLKTIWPDRDSDRPARSA